MHDLRLYINACRRQLARPKPNFKMHAFYCDSFELPLPPNHRFPMAKYRLLREAVAQQLPEIKLQEPLAATLPQLRLAHDADYIEAVLDNTLPIAVQKAIGFPWSEAMVERSRRSAGATLAAATCALRTDGVAVNLAGGTHHAMRNKAAGFCVFNDAAIAAKTLQAGHFASTGEHLRVAVIDLDVHQGDGTAHICAGDTHMFTLSLHGEYNFPALKQRSSLDIGLPDGCQDDAYLAELTRGLTAVQAFSPQLIIYLAGADPHEGDRLGRLKLSEAGLAARDAAVFDWCAENRVPLAVAMAGGYNHDIQTTVRIHLQTVRAAHSFWLQWNAC
jgi:acetoin utilization deacetylase AcuC-like enzyme